MTKEEFMDLHPEPRGEPARAFHGFSEYNEQSTSESFHKAVQQAAFAAAAAAREEGRTEPEWFEVSRVRILVGNPNVKLYAATIVSTGSGSGR